LLATSSGTWRSRRIEGAGLLAKLDPDQGVRLLRELSETRRFSHRVEAAAALAELDSFACVELLTALAEDDELPAGTRLDAAQELVRIDPARGIDLLAAAAGAVLDLSLRHQDTHLSRRAIRRSGLRGLGLEQSRRQHRADELHSASAGVRALADADADRAVALLRGF
jgi:hypothetical protein